MKFKEFMEGKERKFNMKKMQVGDVVALLGPLAHYSHNKRMEHNEVTLPKELRLKQGELKNIRIETSGFFRNKKVGDVLYPDGKIHTIPMEFLYRYK